jgi:three-Cys-motif partner protein
MPVEDFYDEMTEQSQAKVAIVGKYFWVWAKIMAEQVRKTGGNRIAYADLFAGRGRYEDGTESTPLLVLRRAISDPLLRKMLAAVFNDSKYAEELQREINALPGVDQLEFAPKVWGDEVGPDLVNRFERAASLPPTLLFIDPWGYKGLSLRLVKSVLRHWGCECIFFFNYKRVNAGLSNPVFVSNMNEIFGEERANYLRPRLEGLMPRQREAAIVSELLLALHEAGGNYVIPFCFKNDQGTRTSHHLIFVTKNIHGYTLMKGIMAGESSQVDQGVASFAYCPADKRFPLLYGYSRPLDELADMLLKKFAGQSLTMRQVFESHHVNTPYIDKNYKEALKKLEAEGKITADPPARQRRRVKGEVSFGDNVLVHFPPGGE